MRRVYLFLLLLPLFGLLVNCNTDPKAASKRYVTNGNKYFEREKYKEASIMYRKALQKDIRNSSAWYQLGQANEKLRNFGEARRDFARAMDVDPNNMSAIVKLADVDLAWYMTNPSNNKVAQVELSDLTKTILKKNPKSYDGLRFSGFLALMYEKKLDKAIDYFEQANQAKPYQPDLMLTLVQTLFASKQSDLAEKYAKETIERNKASRDTWPMYDLLYRYYRVANPPAAEQILKQKIQNFPKEGVFQVQLALHYYITNRKDDMQAALSRLTSDLKTYPNAHLLAGDFYFQIHDFEAAAQQYNQGQKDDPKAKSLYLKRMVEVLAVQGKNDQASKVIAQLLKEDSKDPEAIAMHAALLLQTGNKDQIRTVIGELQPLVAKSPKSTILHYNLGRAYLAVGDSQSLEQAKLQFEETLKIRADYMPARMALAEMQVAQKDYAKAVQTAEEILAADPKNFGAMLIRVDSLLRMGEFNKARAELDAASKLYPRSNDLRNELGQLDYAEKKFADAEAAFTSLWKAHDQRGFMGLVECKMSEGHLDEALKLLQEQVDLAPDRADMRLALANVQMKAGKAKDAVGNYQKVVEKNPTSAEMYVHLGEAKRDSGDLNGAIAAYKRASELAPKNPVPTLELGMLLSDNSRNDEARKLYEDVLKLDPNNPVALNNLAYSKADDGVDLDQALMYAQKAQQKLPNNLDVIDTMGLIYIRKNLTDDAVRLLKDLVSRSPNRATYHLHLAAAYYQKGERGLAKKELDQAERTKPSEKEQSQIKTLMQKVG
jgi:tetratricopeptide (TPR) repeat protein